MSDVSRRVTETLDLDTVLQEVVDGACSLTEARYGALAAFDDSGQVGELFISGITAGERKMMGPMPKGRGLIGYLNEIQAPLRLADLSKHPRSACLPDFLPPMKTFLGSPIHHRPSPEPSRGCNRPLAKCRPFQTKESLRFPQSETFE